MFSPASDSRPDLDDPASAAEAVLVAFTHAERAQHLIAATTAREAGRERPRRALLAARRGVECHRAVAGARAGDERVALHAQMMRRHTLRKPCAEAVVVDVTDAVAVQVLEEASVRATVARRRIAVVAVLVGIDGAVAAHGAPERAADGAHLLRRAGRAAERALSARRLGIGRRAVEGTHGERPVDGVEHHLHRSEPNGAVAGAEIDAEHGAAV